jgi:hypothetical protein
LRQKEKKDKKGENSRFKSDFKDNKENPHSLVT